MSQRGFRVVGGQIHRHPLLRNILLWLLGLEILALLGICLGYFAGGVDPTILVAINALPSMIIPALAALYFWLSLSMKGKSLFAVFVAIEPLLTLVFGKNLTDAWVVLLMTLVPAILNALLWRLVQVSWRLP